MRNLKALVFLLFFFLLGCSAKDAAIQRKDIDGGTLVFSLGGDISILNPILSSDTASSAVEGVIFSGLTKVNEKLEIVPDMAKKWDISRDGKTYTFYLRDDIYWHDGKKFTAQDVKFTFDSILDPKVNSVRRGDYVIDGIPIKFVVAGPYVVRAFLPKPFAPFLSRVGMGVIPKHILAGKDINTSNFNQKPVGTGPFVFKEWISGDRAVVSRNPRYYGGIPRLERIVYKIIPDENSRLIALEAGEADVSDVPPKDYTRVRSFKKVNVFEYDSLTYTFIGFNLRNPLFSDARTRKALAYATDKEQLIGLVLRGLGSAAYSPMAPAGWAYEPGVNKYPYDLKKAAMLLDSAGWIVGRDGIRERQGKKFEFTILVNQGNKEREKAAVILQWQYKKLGIKVNVRVMEWSALLRIINSRDSVKDFDAVIIGWSLGIDPDAYSIWHSSQYPLGLNFTGYDNPVIDRLLEKGRITVEKKKRKEIYGKFQKIIADDQPYIFLWYPKSITAVSDRVGGLAKPGPAGLFVDMEKIFIKDKK